MCLNFTNSKYTEVFSSVQFSSHAQSCPTICDRMNRSTPGFPVHYQTPAGFSNSCQSSWWCHPTISSSVVPFSSCLQSFPTSWYFPVSRLFTSGGQSNGDSASASVLPMNIQGLFPLRLICLISLLSVGLLTSPAPQLESINSLVLCFLHGPALTSMHDYCKNHSFDYMDLCQQSNVSF